MLKISINILTWNTLPTTEMTLETLKSEMIGIDHEIIMVDNGSIDGCQDLATIKNPTNLGISKGKNQGIDASKGEFIFLIDGDVVPVPNSIRLMLKHMEANPGCMALGVAPDKFCNNVRGEYERFCAKLDPIREHFGHCIYYGMYRREIFQTIRFDEQYGVGYGYEDLDTFMQMERAGIKQWVAGINHEAGKYLHMINSSINNKNCLGFPLYMKSSVERSQIFKKKWDRHVVHNPA